MFSIQLTSTRRRNKLKLAFVIVNMFKMTNVDVILDGIGLSRDSCYFSMYGRSIIGCRPIIRVDINHTLKTSDDKHKAAFHLNKAFDEHW